MNLVQLIEDAGGILPLEEYLSKAKELGVELPLNPVKKLMDQGSIILDTKNRCLLLPTEAVQTQ